MYFANVRCADDMMYVIFSSFESESNSGLCNLLSSYQCSDNN